MAGKRDQSGAEILRQLQQTGSSESNSRAQQQIAEAIAAMDAEQEKIKEEAKKQKQSILTKKDVKEIFEELYKKEEDKRDKKLKSTLKQAFKEMYDAEEKKRQATSPQSAIDSQAQQNESQDYKRDINEMRFGLSGIGAVGRENNALLRQQIELQTRSISLLNEISQNIKSNGGGGLGVLDLLTKTGGARGATSVAGAGASTALIGGAIAAAGGVATHFLDKDESKAGNSTIGSWINENIPGAAAVDNFAYEATGGLVGTSSSDSRLASPSPSSPPPSSPSSPDSNKNQTAAIVAAENKGAKKNLSVKADNMSFKAKKLTFNVESLKISAKSVQKSQISQLEQKNVSVGAGGSATQKGGGAPGTSSSASVSPGSAPGATPGSSMNVSGTGGSTGSSYGGSTGAAPKAAGSSENAKKALEYFKQQGWSPEQAAAIVGNLQAESGKDLNPGAVGDSGKAHGIAQWHPDRRKNFEKVYGKPFSESTFEEQLSFVNWELTHTEKKAGDRLREARSPAEAAAIVDQFYERSSGQHRAQRIANATSLHSGKETGVDASKVTTAQTVGAGAGRGSVVEKQGERAAAMASMRARGTPGQFASLIKDNETTVGTIADQYTFDDAETSSGKYAKPEAKSEVTDQYTFDDAETSSGKYAKDNRPWWKKFLGVTDETVAKTLELEKNGPVMTAMGDIAAPGGAYVPEAKPDLTLDSKTNIMDDIKPRKLEPRMTTKTQMVDDPNWDRHAKSRAMYEEATAREQRGENSQSIYWAAEEQRKKELAMKAPQIKKTVKVAEKGDFGNPLANALEYGTNPFEEPKNVDAQFMGVTDPEVLGETSIPQVQAIKDASAVRSSGEAMAAMREAAPRLAMEDKDREDMYGESTRLQREQIVKTATSDNLVAGGMSPAKAGKTATPRNAALTIGGGPEAGREQMAARENSENNMDIVGEKPEATMNGGDSWLSKFFPYLYGNSNKPSLAVGAD